MADIGAVWSEVLPEVRKGVTGVGVWAALNACKPIVLESGVFVLGLAHQDQELAGHLKMASTKRLIEQYVSLEVGAPVTLRVIEGNTEQDWETEKRRDQEKRKLQDRALERHRREVASRVSWEGIYEQLSRKYAALPNRTLPQNRAKFLIEAVDIIVDALLTTPITDELSERNYARCIERVAQYSEVPSAIVALKILERTFQG